MDSFKDKIRNQRTEYNLGMIDSDAAPDNPLELFQGWLEMVIENNVPEPNAMCLSTVTGAGRPSSRIVLLRNYDESGFVFFSNYQSHKGIHLQKNPFAALNFFWAELHKQVRIEGAVTPVTDEVSEAYFASRPRESQLGAWASDQSRVLKNREEIDQKIKNLTKQYEGKPIPRPPHWGGYNLKPDYYEFWQGRNSRLHDRLAYLLQKDHTWKKQLLNP